jgi:nitrite reductase/ring-hydroxylating ferredoxin subunit
MIIKEIISISVVDKSKGYLFESDKFNDEILVYFKENNYFAISSFCPHFGGPLSFSGEDIRCYWHGWKFDLNSHKCINRQVNCRLKTYNVIKKNTSLEISNGN